MRYLKHGFCVPNEKWKEVLEAGNKSYSLFCKTIFRYFHTDEKIVQLCLQQNVKDPVLTPNGTHKREIVDGRLIDTIKGEKINC